MRYSSLALIVFIAFSCSNKNVIDQKTAGLVPIENIQVLFERHVPIDELPFISEKRGNTLLIKNIPEALTYLNANEPVILLDPALRFVWDTVGTDKKLYAIDNRKIFPLKVIDIKSVTTNNNQPAKELVLPDQIKKSLAPFFVSAIGKEMIAVDQFGIIAGASHLGKTENGNILIRQIIQP